MKKCLTAAIIILTLGLAGCSSSTHLRELFKDGPRVMVDETSGNRYIITHHIGDTFTLTRVYLIET